MKFILGKKLNMTQVFNDEGRVFPATVITTGPNLVTQVKNKEKDGYGAVQIGFGKKSPKKVSKALKGHLGEDNIFAHIKEFRGENLELEKGNVLDLGQFNEGDKVSVSAISKGKGFQGVVKRHGFAGGPRTHGQKHSEREPGSIGIGGVQRVFKGTRMAGRMGSDKITLKKVEILKILPETNEIILKGSIPGRRGTLISIQG